MATSAGYPSGWHTFGEHALRTGAEFFGFKRDLSEVNRFAARFRAARSFRGIKLDGYSAGTELGYAALCRVLFVYSAFEAYLDVTGNTQVSIGPVLAEHGAKPLHDHIRAVDSDDRFYKFIYGRVNASHQRELDSYFNDDPCNVAYLASAIRHIFAHGWLTPSAGGGESTEAERICHALSEFLLEFMDNDFKAHVDAGMHALLGHMFD